MTDARAKGASCRDAPDDSSLLTPISFNLPGRRPDVVLQVFTQLFNVHSEVLQLYSDWFRRYLQDRKPSDGGVAFACRRSFGFVTHVNSDGSWVLVRSEHQIGQNEAHEFVGNNKTNIQAFKSLLSSLYQQRLVFTSVNHLQRTTALAAQYGCLPALSQATTAALFTSPALTRNIRDHCVELLPIAAALKHPLLFKECLIYLTGPMSKPRYLELEDSALKAIAERAYNSILAQVGKFQLELFNIGARWNDKETWVDFSARITALSCECMVKAKASDTQMVMLLPLYYRRIYDLHVALSRRLHGLLKNNLCLERSGLGAGQKDTMMSTQGNEDYFFCAEISDSDLPWNESSAKYTSIVPGPSRSKSVS